LKHLNIYLKFKIYNLKFLRLKKFFEGLRKHLKDSIYQRREQSIGAGGFTLIEVVIALAIFSFIIGGIISFSVNSVKASQKSQAIQEATDNARYAIDDLAKKVRTSSGAKIVSPGGEVNSGLNLFFVDNKTLVKYCYGFDNGEMQVAKIVPALNQGAIDLSSAYSMTHDCNKFSPSSFTSIVGKSNGKVKIDGKFKLLPTDISSDTPHRGYVQINLNITYNDAGGPDEKSAVHIQSGVSLANYGREDNPW